MSIGPPDLINALDMGRFCYAVAIDFSHHELLAVLHQLDADFGLTDDEGKSALHYAVCMNKLDCVKTILKCRPDLLHVSNTSIDGETALYYACIVKTPKMIKLLLDHGARVVNLPYVTDKECRSLFEERAIFCSDWSHDDQTILSQSGFRSPFESLSGHDYHQYMCSKWFKCGTDVDRLCQPLESYLPYLYRHVNVDSFAGFVERMQVDECVMFRALQALFTSCFPEELRSIDFILSRGVNINSISKKLSHQAADTLLGRAIKLNNIEVVDHLIHLGADVNGPVGNDGQGAYQLAVEYNANSIQNLLLKVESSQALVPFAWLSWSSIRRKWWVLLGVKDWHKVCFWKRLLGF